MLRLLQRLLPSPTESPPPVSRSGRLAIVERRDPVREQSTELTFLRALIAQQAREAFDVALTVASDDLPGSLDWADCVLLLDHGDAFVSGRSLGLMRDVLRAAGRRAVVPRSKDEFPANAASPVYTQSAFEAWEACALRARYHALRETGRLPPVCLVRASDLRGAAEGVREWIADRIGLGQLLTDLPILRAGVCLELPDYYGHSREEVLALVPRDARSILEVGCGKGRTGARLRERGGVRVTGIEINEAVAVHATSNLDSVIVGDATSVEIPGRFDVILALDVIEHMADPDSFLVRVPGLLQRGGVLILSVPNVGHYAVVQDLLAGRWDYVPMGHLCCTHQRFFTRRTLCQLLRQAGMTDFEVRSESTPLPEELRAGLAGLPEADLESLSTAGFIAIVRNAAATGSSAGAHAIRSRHPTLVTKRSVN